MKILSILIVVLFVGSMAFLMYGNLGIPEGLTPVKGFEADRFQGTWYEVARLNHGFEKDLSHVSADYQSRSDGGYDVTNRGFNMKSQAWEVASAKAYFLDGPETGRMKVSFSGPFYGAYNIIELDQKGYTYAMVTGPKKNFFWILSRTRTLDPAVMQQLILKARDMGFKLENLVYVNQDPSAVPSEEAAKEAEGAVPVTP